MFNVKSVYRICFVLLAAFSLAFGAVGLTPAHAQSSATWYVATTGNDSNSCASAGAPCLTIDSALGKAAAGDTIKVATGTYTATSGDEVVLIDRNLTLSGGWNAGFTAQSGTSTIDGQGVRRGITMIYSSIIDEVDGFTIQHGYSAHYGGGIYAEGTLTLKNSNVLDNVSEHGAGISNSGTLTINNSSITGNTASPAPSDNAAAGGGISNYYGILTLNNSTVSENNITGQYHPGGGIYTYTGTTILNNTTVSKNGGDTDAIFSGNSSLTLNNSTVSDNSGKGIDEGGPGTVTLQNSILAGNNPDCAGNISSAGYNLIGNTTGCNFTPAASDLVNITAGLGELIGSPAYVPLLAGSPAIDAGNPATPGSGGDACLATDQRGVARPIGASCDMGAYEYSAPGPAASISTLDGTPQRAAPLMKFFAPFKVAVFDSLGSPVSGAVVTFSAPASGASGSFADSGTDITTATTEADGIATAAIFTANGVQGIYLVSASASGVGSSADFSLTNSPGWFVAGSGNDTNSCNLMKAACKTINGALGKASAGDTIFVATGTYTGSLTSGEVVHIDKSISLSGGWDASFTAQSGESTIDGQAARQGILVQNDFPISVVVDHFSIRNGYAISGGGVANSSTLTLSNSIINHNIGTSDGGGIVNSGTLTINNTIISGNTAGNWNEYGSYGGGGIENYGTVILNNSSVNANTLAGGTDGSGIHNMSGTFTINNSTISGNTADAGKSGVKAENGALILNNSTVSANTGIGISRVMGHVVLNNTTISGNPIGIYSSADYPGGGITLQNSIVAGNTVDCHGPLTSSGYNLIGNTAECTFSASSGDLTNIDALLGPLTGFPAYVPLRAGSPAIDAGNPATPGSGGTACLATDQRGMARPQRSACDIGAYEWVGLAISGNAGEAGTVLSYHDGIDKTAIADASGNYAFGVVDGWNGTVTPSKLGFSFSPASIDYSVAPGPVTSDLTGQDYVATRSGYIISGNTGVAGATLGYNDNGSKTAIADSDGNYVFIVSINWSGTVTPKKLGYAFVPANRVYTNLMTDLPSENYAVHAMLPMPISPAGVTTDTTPTFIWDKVGGVTKYQYQLWKGNSLVYAKTLSSKVCGATTCQNTPTKILNLAAYRWRIRAMKGGVWKVYTPYQSFSIVSKPKAGFWSGPGMEFYVTPDQAHVTNFAIYVNVKSCGTYKITHIAAMSSLYGKFTFGGSFYATGIFDTVKSAHGILGLLDYIPTGCGKLVTTGSLSWKATWKNATQPAVEFSADVTPDLALPWPQTYPEPYNAELVGP